MRFEQLRKALITILKKPITSENLVALIKRALRARSLVETTMYSAPTLSLGNESGDDKFVGHSHEMKKVFNLVSKLAQVNTPVLIRGESGTGKELVAKAIHYNGPRKDSKFVTINCGAIAETLIESELFGHEKGAFTGADSRKIGKFQYAEGGTLFLDEIGDISPAMQVKLLRVLQEKSFTPVGSNREIKVEVRIIAASHKPFEEMIKQGTFREDLFYRLNVLPVYLPPLRERKDDIPHLVNYYLNYFNNYHNLKLKGFKPDAIEALKKYRWPGNIRELRNVIEHCFIMESSDEISLASLPSIITDSKNDTKFDVENDDQDDLIDFEQIQNSVLDSDKSTGDAGKYQFTFAAPTDKADSKLDFQIAKDQFEKELLFLPLKLIVEKLIRRLSMLIFRRKHFFEKLRSMKLIQKSTTSNEIKSSLADWAF
jgi:two-component system response regulator HydG